MDNVVVAAINNSLLLNVIVMVILFFLRVERNYTETTRRSRKAQGKWVARDAWRDEEKLQYCDSTIAVIVLRMAEPWHFLFCDSC